MSEKTAVIGKTIKHGKQTWRITGDHWEVLMFGSFPTTKVGLEWKWVEIAGDKVPEAVRKLALNST